MPKPRASSFVRRRLLRWGPTGMALSSSVVASPTYPTPRYATVFVACMPRWAGASRWIMSPLPTAVSRPHNRFPRRSAASDSLSALGTSPQAVVGDSANTTEESLLNSVFMGEPFRFSAAVSDSTKDDMRPDKRIFDKQIHGALGGFIISLGALSAAEESASILVPIGYSLGTAIGVSKIDPHDRFIASLGGSVVGLIGGIGLTSISKVLFPSLLVGPIIGATIMSERWRKPPQARRVSVGLVPESQGRPISHRHAALLNVAHPYIGEIPCRATIFGRASYSPKRQRHLSNPLMDTVRHSLSHPKAALSDRPLWHGYCITRTGSRLLVVFSPSFIFPAEESCHERKHRPPNSYGPYP